jgi:hypothetical protein
VSAVCRSGGSLRRADLRAAIDRLTFAGQIIETGSTSYRLAHARTIKPPRKAPRPDCQTEPMNSVVP